jgi:hypothetical protein
MTPSGDMVKRLVDHFCETVKFQGVGEMPQFLLVRHPDRAVVVERNTAAEARIECSFPDDTLCVQWNWPTGLFQFLKEESNADGALLIWRNDGSRDGLFDAHIMECKKTITFSTWEKALVQLRWTFMRLRAVAGALGVPLGRVTFYTAYRVENISSDSSRNPVLLRLSITSQHATPDNTTLRQRQLRTAWETGDISLGDFDGRFAHRKIHLDENGNKAIELL